MTQQNDGAASGGEQSAPGLSILTKLMISFFGFILVLGVLLVLVYQRYVPALVLDQIDVRAESVTRSFASAALKPVVERNYLRVNKIAEATAELPDVAYASALNSKGMSVAGIFGDMERFDRNFADLVRQQGFPKEIVERTRLKPDTDFARTSFTAGGQEIVEYAMRLGDSGAEVHVGLFTAGVQQAVDATLFPLLILLGVMAVVGGASVALVARTVSRPIRQLSEQAEYISTGHLDREIDIKAGGEIWLLAQSFKRMQASIKFSIMQMRRRQGG